MSFFASTGMLSMYNYTMSTMQMPDLVFCCSLFSGNLIQCSV